MPLNRAQFGRLWHGTTQEGAASILHEGFRHDVEALNGRSTGNAIYLSVHPEVADNFARPRKGVTLPVMVSPEAKIESIQHPQDTKFKADLMEMQAGFPMGAYRTLNTSGEVYGRAAEMNDIDVLHDMGTAYAYNPDVLSVDPSRSIRRP